MKYKEEDKSSQVFPVPPQIPRLVSFSLRRVVSLNVQGWSESATEKITYLGGMGESASWTGNGDVAVTHEKEWVPSPKGLLFKRDLVKSSPSICMFLGLS